MNAYIASPKQSAHLARLFAEALRARIQRIGERREVDAIA